MSFKDIFKKSFLEGFASTEITTLTVVTALGVACLLALYIFFVYRVVTRKTFYSKNFNITLAGVTVITASLILTMQSSVVLSLGMVGALSIVRFRTAIKEPMDLMFLFWSISVGIICGAGLAQVAVILSVVMTLGILILDRLPVARAPMIFVVNAITSTRRTRWWRPCENMRNITASSPGIWRRILLIWFWSCGRTRAVSWSVK